MPPETPDLLRRARSVAGAAARRTGLRPGAPTPPASRITAKGRQVLLDTPLFDQHWVEQQLGRKLGSRAAAVDAYVANPALSPHPLFFIEAVDPRFGRPPALRNPLLWFLNNHRVRSNASPHPLVDLEAITRADPAAAEHRLGPLVGWLERATPDSVLPGGPDAPTVTLGEVAVASARALRQWQRDLGLRNAPRVSAERPGDLLEPGTMPVAPDDGTPLVSIVMPLWNRATVVRDAVESVQRQTFGDWELLIVDDGSTDDSLSVVRGMAAFDERIVVVPAGHHGVSAARNTGLARARGRYVAFLDTDNQWRPGFLQVMLAELEAHPDWQMAHAALQAARDGEVYYRAFEGTHRHLLVANHIDLNVLVARRELVTQVGGFDESLRRGVDYDLVLKMAERTPPHLVSYLGVDYTDDSDDATAGPRISNQESPAWLSVIASRHLVDWEAARAAERVPGHTSVVLPAAGSIRPLVLWLRAVSAAAREGLPVDAVVVGERLPRSHHVLLGVLTEVLGHARLVTLQMDRGAAVRANVGFAATRGEQVVLVLDPIDPDLPAALRLAGALEDGVAFAQPLVLDTTRTVQTAGAAFDDDLAVPYPFLAGHPAEDARRAGRRPVPAAAGPVVAMRGEHLADLDGLDALCGPLTMSDLSLRGAAAGHGATGLVPDVEIVARPTPTPDPAVTAAAMRTLAARHRPPGGSADAWRAAGLDVVRHRYDVLPGQATGPEDNPALCPSAVLQPLRGSLQVTQAAPVLRWAIDLASPAGPKGLAWGDTHFGEALAAALRRLGQHVAVDAREQRHRPSRDLDDVVLVLRGLDLVVPRPGRVNLEWVISHPDLVTPQEVARFDRVYAASVAWSEQVSAEWGVEVRPLLQATDPTLFHPGRATFDTGPEVLFVGNSRGVYRTSLRHANAAGLPVTVHGAGWHDILPEGAVSSLLVDNAELGELYASAGVVLNDHWEDMRAAGFVSNRLMDAAAAGARVASDDVPGVDLRELFHGLVQPWQDQQELVGIVAQRETLFPDEAGRRAAAELVAAEHSFDARAAQLLDDAVQLLMQRSARAHED
ncbi:glycosyltransferase [Nocardioides sp. cx-173]|uniref:glycosyltransferase n=1 Tax=Nocardioides sp. cx-173 TaxID=2898796 RepID=UPI001E2A57E4|nr:glycosyltransferase [Nocardioides sp. cx-173]MCD4524765.1 glycosyltransferase [Nocardioides sp. cx-173]UGB43273.1 glycosyltransferase [Nocardioides sp. cx-173]